MEPDCNRLSEHILQFTLEIIYLLTGEDDIVVKKTAEDGQDPVMVPLRSLLIPQRKNEQKILEISKKITDLLTAQNGKLVNFNIRIKEEIKREERESEPFTSPDGSSFGSPPERCPRPLFSQDSSQQDHNIPHHDQEEAMGKKVAIKKEEDSYGRDDDEPLTYDEIMEEPDEERSSLSVRTGGNSGWISSEGRIVISADYNKEDNGMAQYSPGNSEKSFLNKHDEMVVHQRVPSLDKPFTCYVCEKSFINKSRLSQHLRIHTGIKPCPCYICGKAFIDKSQLNRHQKIHTGERPFSCPECGKRFPSKGNRDKHMRVHTEKNCNRNAPERGPRPLYIRDLTKEDHTIPRRDQGEEVMGIKIVVIEEEEPYSMDVQSTKEDGNRMSISKEGSSLDVSTGESNGWISPEGPVLSADYNKEDNGMAPYSSRDYVKPLIRTHELIVHERVPSIEKPFSCSECDKSFINKSRLVQHLRIHTGEKPFSCAVCGKSFIDKSQLNRHQIVHTGEKPFSCPECEKRFPSKGNRDKHMRIHSGEKPFPCPECGKCFAQKVTLLLHQRKHSVEDQ